MRQAQLAEKCLECGGAIVKAGRELVCSICGLVAGLSEDAYDTGPEWRTFNPEEVWEKSRAGPPTTQTTPSKVSPTMVEAKPLQKGPTQRRFTLEELAKARKLEFLHKRFIKNGETRSLQEPLILLDRIAGKLHLPEDLKEQAAALYRQAQNRRLTAGRNINEMVAACIYAATRMRSLPRTLSEIAKAAGIPRRKVARNYRVLALNLKLNPPIQTAECWVSRIRERLKLPAAVEVEALKILRAVKAAALGRHPASLAAAAIYEAASQQATPVTQKMAAEAAEITEVSVRNNIHHIRKALGRMKP